MYRSRIPSARGTVAVRLGCLVMLAGACGGTSLFDLTAPDSFRSQTLADGGGLLEESPQRPMRTTVPLRGWWSNTESPPVATADCVVRITTQQAGRATHLGRFTGEGATCANPTGEVEEPPFWDHDPAPPYVIMDFTNEMTWRAANGDRLHLSPNSGVFVMSLTNGAASVRGSLTVSGGTGRFAGARGTVEVTGGREPGAPGDKLQFDGEITLEH